MKEKILSVEEISQKLKKLIQKDKKLEAIVKKIWLFGSYARGEQRKDSDIDFMIEFKETTSLMKIVQLQFDLENLFKKKTDLCEKGALKKSLKKYIKKDICKIYEG